MGNTYTTVVHFFEGVIMKDKQDFIIKMFLVVFLSFQALVTKAQVTITGTVIDENSSSLPSATVLLLSPSDSSMVKGAITDNSGIYLLEGIASGSYLLSVSMIGFQKYVSDPFHVDQKTIEFQTLQLKAAIEQLGEVSVTARRPLFEQEIDRLVVNVQRSITSSGGTVLEVLEKSPGIQINRQSNCISMNGKTGVMVMINDKMVRLPMDAVVEMLGGMSAANIDQIELITTPPAKYEAEGDAGIINIKTIEHTDMGYNGSLGGNLGYSGAETLGGHFNVTRRGQKLAWFVNYSINNNVNEERWDNERFLVNNGFTEIVRSDNQRRPTIGVQNARAGMEYGAGPKTTVGLLLTGYQRKWVTRDLSDNFSRLGPDSTIRTEMSVDETNRWRNILVNTSLDHSFNENSTLSLDLDYLYFKNDNPSFFENEFIAGDRNLMDTEGIDVGKETPINIRVARLDYSHRLSGNFTIETGLKGTLSEFSNDVRVSDLIEGNWVVNEDFTNKADLTEKIWAAYLSGNWTPVEDLQINAGLRYEYTDRLLGTLADPKLVDREDGYLFPSLFIQKKWSEQNSVGLSYVRRISRPTFNDLAPFVFFIDPSTFISGNSDLNSAVSDGFKLDVYRRQWLISLQYSFNRDEIARFQPEVDRTTNEQTFSTRNLDYLRTYALTLNAPLTMTPWWEIQTNISGRYQRFKTDHLEDNVRLKAGGLTANAINTFDLSRGFSVELSGYYQSKSILGIHQFRPQGSINAGIQKRVGDGRGTLRLAMDDIFYTDFWRMNINVPEANLNSAMKYDWHSQSVALSFSWNFGNNKIENVTVETGSEEEQSRVN